MVRCKWSSLLTLPLTFLMVTVTDSADADCKKIDSCSCRLTNGGGVVTLRELGNNDNTPLFLNKKATDGYMYSYNPCYPFDESECSKTAICQLEAQNGTTKSIASQKGVQFGMDGKDVQVTYTSQDPIPNIAEVSYVCVPHLTKHKFTAYGYNNVTRKYLFQVQSQCACGNVCYHADEDEGLSAGSIILIIFFVFVGLYLIVGTIYGKVVRGASGVQMLPNYEFWVAFPGLVKQGCLSVVRCACCRPAPRTYDEV